MTDPTYIQPDAPPAPDTLGEAVKRTAVSLLTSKKFIATVAGVAAGFAAKYGLEIDTVTLIALLTPVVAFIIGQGQADKGKEAAKINAASLGVSEVLRAGSEFIPGKVGEILDTRGDKLEDLERRVAVLEDYMTQGG